MELKENLKSVITEKNEFEIFLAEKLQEDVEHWKIKVRTQRLKDSELKKRRQDIKELLERADKTLKSSEDPNIRGLLVEKANEIWAIAAFKRSFIGSLKCGLKFFQYYRTCKEEQKYENLYQAIKALAKCYICAQYPEEDSYDLFYIQNNYQKSTLSFKQVAKNYSDLALNNFKTLIVAIDQNKFKEMVARLLQDQESQGYACLLYLVESQYWLTLKDYPAAVFAAAKASQMAADEVTEAMPPQAAQAIVQQAFSVLQTAFKQASIEDMQKIKEIEFTLTNERIFECDPEIAKKLYSENELGYAENSTI